MKRYSKDPYCRCSMEPSDSGAWVLFEDIVPPAGWEDDLDATLRARQAEIDRLRHLLNLARADCNDQAKRLQDIGDYAHGESTGPAEPDALWHIRAMAYGLGA